ncbi:MAG TPA: TonB-dependent receptor, partial [Parvularculaceae bacterium]|nr:TonB-dependent receptor [Parvularculaceae bacterium]
MSTKFGNLKTILAAGVAAAPLLAVAPAPVLAQDESADSREEIVVTARRREENLQDVPVAVSSFNGDELDNLAAIDLTHVQTFTPNITLQTSRSTNTTLTAFIRGVGQQDPVAGFEAGVGIYIDDVYLNRPQAALLDVYDVERIEVLRGPQGTLYGRNTIGGAVKYVTRRLSDEPEARLRLTGGNYGQFDAVGSFNLPLAIDSSIGDLKLGGAVAYLSRNGYGDNLTNGLGNYNKDMLAGRLSLEWEPTSNFSFRVTGDWTDDNSDPKQGHRILAYPGYPVLENVYDTTAGLNNPKQSVVARG